LLLFSGKSARAAEGNVERLRAHLGSHASVNLADVAYTLQAGREAHAQRRAIAVRDVAHAAEALATKDAKLLAAGTATDTAPSVVFMFPGGGAQYADMGRGLYARYPVYKQAIDQCLELLRGMVKEDLRALLFPAPVDAPAAAERIQDPQLALPVLFATEYALAQLLDGVGHRARRAHRPQPR
jgi:phthiocerol/phenolphthiocerol synthesis type-I polyketide synthase E